jgi:hypothetical protein
MLESGENNTLSCLDLTMYNHADKTEFNLHQNPAATDLLITNDLCHPYKHKKSS